MDTTEAGECVEERSEYVPGIPVARKGRSIWCDVQRTRSVCVGYDWVGNKKANYIGGLGEITKAHTSNPSSTLEGTAQARWK